MSEPIGAGGLSRRMLLGGLAASACMAASRRVVAQPEESRETLSQSIQINARSIAHFQPGRPDVRRFGDLEFRGGLVLTSPSEHFGGWSGLVMEADGKSMLSVSDIGSWLRADVVYEGNRPAALAACASREMSVIAV